MELTNYELLDVMASWKADTAFNLTSMMSIVSAYLLVAYFVGSRLTKAQVLIITGLMMWFAGITIIQLSSNLRTLIEFNQMDYELYGAHADVVVWSKVSRWIVISGCTAVLLAALKFMWDVRHPKAE